MTVNPTLPSELVPNAERPAAVADHVLSEVIAGIRAAQARHGFALIQEVGRLVLDTFYGGDVDLLRQRGPKDTSLRKLAEHADLPMSAAALYVAIATYLELERRPGVYTSKHLTPTHVRAVLPLPEKERDRLLQRAEERAWTVHQLEQEARKAKGKNGKSGRPPLPRFVKSIHALRKFADHGDDLFGDLDAIDTLEPDEAKALYETVTGLKRRCEALQERLQAKVP